jgi:hypothetical protein
MSTFLSRILRIEPGVTLGQWIYDRLANNWPLLSSTLGGGAVIVYTASITEWLKPWGPIAYATLGLGAALTIFVIFASFFWLYASGKVKIALSRYSDASLAASTINPLDDNFVKRRIRLSDFANALQRKIRAVKFQDCEIYGPALIFLNGCHFGAADIINCDFVILSDTARPHTLTWFESCIFERCQFCMVTMFVTQDQANQLKQVVGDYMNVISQKGEELQGAAYRR